MPYQSDQESLRAYPRLTVNLAKLKSNISSIVRTCADAGSDVAGVVKGFNGLAPALGVYEEAGAAQIAAISLPALLWSMSNSHKAEQSPNFVCPPGRINISASEKSIRSISPSASTAMLCAPSTIGLPVIETVVTAIFARRSKSIVVIASISSKPLSKNK